GDVGDLMRHADSALRFAKTRGKNRIERYDTAYAQWLRRRTTIEQELRGALDRGELSLAYQPVVALPDARMAGAEVLLRWHHPVLGAVSPAEFIPVADDCGLVVDLGAFVLNEACRQVARWAADGHDAWVSVNTSVRELRLTDYR